MQQVLHHMVAVPVPVAQFAVHEVVYQRPCVLGILCNVNTAETTHVLGFF